jgi:RNA polymerase sigma-70 factor (ECF subfamily)
MFFARVARHLEELSDFVRHQIAHLEAIGDLAAGELTPDEVIDEVLLRAHREFDGDVDDETLRRRLTALVRETLATAVKSARAWRFRTPARLETDIPDTPPHEWVTTLGDERLEFWEPDEDLKLEDLIPDLEMPTPEDEAARREIRECVRAALAGLPREWRRALLLRHIDGLAGARLSRALGKSPSEVHRILDHAQHYLRQRLVDSGCRFRRPAAA